MDPSTPRPSAPEPGATQAGPAALDARRRRLLFRATHRGTYENDLLVGGFVRARIATFTETELDEVEALMEHPDADLADWLTGRQPIPPGLDTPMLRAVREAAPRHGQEQARGHAQEPVQEQAQERGSGR